MFPSPRVSPWCDAPCSPPRLSVAAAFAVTLVVVAGTAAAQQPESAVGRQPVTLESLLTLALANNPEINAAGARVSAAAQRPEQAASLPDPMAGLIVRNVGFPELTLGEEMMSVLGVRFTQPLPAGGKRPQRRELADRGIDLAAARRESIRRRVTQEIATAFYELAFVHESIAIVAETRALLADLEDTAEARYAVGTGIQQDVLKAHVELSVLLNRIIQLEQQRDSLEARINRLVGRPVTTPVGIPSGNAEMAAALDLQGLLGEAAAASAPLIERGRRIEQQEASVELVRRDRKPDWVVSGAWMHRGGLPSIWEINVGITLPIRKSQRQDHAIEEALQELRARHLDRVDAAQAVDQLIRDSHLRVDRAERLIELFRDAIIPQAILSLESALAGYGVGKVDFLTVLDNVVTLLTYRLELERESTSYLTALVRIEEHLGRSLGATPESAWRNSAAGAPAAGIDTGLSAPAVGGRR